MTQFHNLDLEFLKNDIKNYIKNNSTLLEDYNYEGSAISNMINVLAYVTQYNLFYLNSVTNELFINSAQLSNSVHRLANMLNYIPKRNVSPSCSVVFSNNTTQNQYLQYGTEFLCEGITLTYVGNVISIAPNESVAVSLYEGRLVVNNWLSDGTPFQSYKLSDKEKVDNRYLDVGVGNGTNSSFDWININNQNPIVGGKYYYIDYLDYMYIKFDNGVLYQIPKANDIISVRYLKTEGNLYANTVVLGSTVTSEEFTLVGTCASNFTNGENAETLDEIKSRAVLNYTTQNRAITQSDYNVFLQKYPGYNNFEDSFIFGGENVYIDVNGNEIEYVAGSSWQDVGYVYVSALKSSDDIYNFGYLTEDDKTSIENFFIPYKVITIFFKFVDPVIVYFSPRFRIKTKSMVEIDVTNFKQEIDDYLTDTYRGMNLSLNKSNIIKYVDSMPTVNYSDLDYDFHCKVNKQNSTYTVIPLNTQLQDVYCHYFDLGTISEQVTVGCVIKNGENEGRILDTNNHTNGTKAVVSVSLIDSSTFSLNDGVELLDSEGTLLATATISDLNFLHIDSVSSTSDLFVTTATVTATIGYVNCNNGFIKIDNYTDTLLNEMETFALEFVQSDDISFTANREVFICPEPSSITYL